METPKPKFDLAELDQLSAHIRDSIVPHFASVFLGFCEAEGVSREEAMQLTIGMMQSRPKAE